MSTLLSHARFLRERNRHEEAVASVMQHLTMQPEDPDGFIELALNRMEIPGMLRTALEDARRAVGLLPAESFPMALESRILSQLDREAEALPVARAAIELDPEDPFSWTSKAIAEIGLSKWADAEQSCRQALSLDSDDETASNLLAHVLRVQGRLDESEEETRRRLARDPENSFSFANSGWAALQRGKVAEAEGYFKESLRLNPEMTYARQGLKQSYRARSAFYRGFLKWAFFLERFSEKNRTLLMIGILFGFRILRTIAAAIHPLLLIAVVVLYFLLVFGSWLAGPVANLMVLRDPLARMSLDRGEKFEGVVVGGGFVLGFFALLVGAMVPYTPLAVIGGALVLAAVPGAMVFTNDSIKGRIVFSLAALLTLALAFKSMPEAWAHPHVSLVEGDAKDGLLAAVFVTVVVSWISMIPSLRKEKPE